ncbi:myelin-oligodendrocyte glycoprotein-like protein [Lates japonicus]|uniref:Myelin-oligodendrocyte glycoprotein-like protein n=1 Tax=Lates japonicus TaxID=270547 RepID=A0AAD3N5G1_LATJO|nr:myelin-oligodendrocyte glycoprotein-like protein [Lates japonicus]
MFGLWISRMLQMMLPPSDGGASRVLFLHHMTFCLLLLQPHTGQPHVVGPSQPVVALLGDNVTLPCRLTPSGNASDMRVEWTRFDLSPRDVHVWENHQEHVDNKYPSYEGRTSLFVDRLERGDVSLQISRVQLLDEGTYRCFVPSQGQSAMVTLVVGAVSSPVIRMTKHSNGVVLECKSKGCSRVTVEKRHSNSFTCRVQQNKTNQAREAHINIAALSWVEISILALGLIAMLLALALQTYTCILRKQNLQREDSQEAEMMQLQQEPAPT